MNNWHGRETRARQAGFAALVGEWLAALPDAGWAGTGGDLSAVLDEFATARIRERYGAEFCDRHGYRHCIYIYRGNGLSMTLDALENMIAEAGWTLTRRRTNRSRLLTFTRKRAKR